jgi:two-component system KDP operon response regulator KdpE
MRECKALLLSDDIEPMSLWAHVLTRCGVGSVVADFTRDHPEDYLEEPPDLILFDVYRALPVALSACRHLRAQLVNPILLMGYFSGEPEMLEAYGAGADECIAKPVGARLLAAKVQAWLRHAWTVPTGAMIAREAGGLRLEPQNRRVVLADDREIGLTNLELRLLYLLMSHPGHVLEPSLIIDRVWGLESAEPAALKEVIYRLRRKIESDHAHPRYIHTVSGGYAFQKD